MSAFDEAVPRITAYLDRVTDLNAQYRAGQIRVHVPEGLLDATRTLETLIEQHLPASHAALQAASRGLFYSLPVAFDPGEAVGPYGPVTDGTQTSWSLITSSVAAPSSLLVNTGLILANLPALLGRFTL